MRRAPCVIVSSSQLLQCLRTTYSGDWADCWLKRNGPDILPVRLQSLHKPRSRLVRLEGLLPYYCRIVQRMRMTVGRLSNGAPEACGACFLRERAWR